MLGEGSSGAQTHWRVPVIMQFDNGNDFADNEINEAIYQVPVIRYDFPSSGTYIVNVIGVPKRDHANGGAVLPSYLYFDGLRVFQPIGASNSAYSADENGAVFYEVRDEIAGGQIAVASYTADTAKVVTSGTMTWTEDYSDGGVFTDVSSVEAYLFSGPNNEAYMRDGAAMVFYVKETGTGAHSLQVALRAVDYFLASSGVEVGMEAAIQYGIIKDGAFAWAPLVTAKSGTEQYYTIDYTQCPQVNGAYQIALRVNGDETEQGMVSYSSLKLVGLELTEAITVSSGSSPAISAICAQMDATEITLPASNVIVPKPYAPIQFPEKPQDKPEQNEPETDGNEEGKNEERKEDLIPLLSLCKLDVTAGDGGTVTPEGDLVIAFGAKRVIKAVPDEGYEVEGIYVNGKNVGAAEKYTVVATGNMKVEVKFVKTDASAE